MTTTNEITVSQSSNLDLAAPYAAYVVQFNQFRSKTAESIIGMAETVYLAKKNLQNANGKGKEKDLQFEEFCKGIRFNGKSSAIRKFLQIGEMADMLKRHADNLPNTWTTIYTLTQLGKDVLEKMIEEQRVIASITAQEAKALIGEKTESSGDGEAQEAQKGKSAANDSTLDEGYTFTLRLDKAPTNEEAVMLNHSIRALMKAKGIEVQVTLSAAMETILSVEIDEMLKAA
jgi:hypothetical protein